MPSLHITTEFSISHSNDQYISNYYININKLQYYKIIDTKHFYSTWWCIGCQLETDVIIYNQCTFCSVSINLSMLAILFVVLRKGQEFVKKKELLLKVFLVISRKITNFQKNYIQLFFLVLILNCLCLKIWLDPLDYPLLNLFCLRGGGWDIGDGDGGIIRIITKLVIYAAKLVIVFFLKKVECSY